MNEIQLKQKYSCFQKGKLTLKAHKNVVIFSESFQLDFNTFLFFIIKLCLKKDKMIL